MYGAVPQWNRNDHLISHRHRRLTLPSSPPCVYMYFIYGTKYPHDHITNRYLSHLNGVPISAAVIISRFTSYARLSHTSRDVIVRIGISLIRYEENAQRF